MNSFIFSGSNILARAITEPDVTAVNVYFPGGASELWYDVERTLLYTGNGYATVSVTLDGVGNRLTIKLEDIPLPFFLSCSVVLSYFLFLQEPVLLPRW